MSTLQRPGLTLFLLLLAAQPVRAQFFGTCRSGAASELDASIAAHEEHAYRLNQKFLDGYYFQGQLPSTFEAAGRADVIRFLRQLAPRRAAALFYAYDEGGRLCTWLMSPHLPLVAHVGAVEGDRFRSLEPRLKRALGVDGLERDRAPRRRGTRNVGAPSSAQMPEQPLDEVIHEVSRVLLPEPTVQALLSGRIETLVIIPIDAVGTIPFAILELGDKALVDVMAVVVAPGFFAFSGEPQRSQRTFRHPVIVGDPTGWKDPVWLFPPLPGARQEALAVAGLLGAPVLTGAAATRSGVEGMLRRFPDTGLIYIASHGIGDLTNPRDASFLLLSDGRWPAADIQNLPLAQARPLVVLSACQTGLGKNFEVGTIGMARAWERAGASNVVMSLWSVEDIATQRMMTRFIELAAAWPVDEALRRAMQYAREIEPHPASWAGFTVFGPPTY